MVNNNGGAATAPVSGSPYAITPSAAVGGTFAAGNYAITYANGNLTVTAAALTGSRPARRARRMARPCLLAAAAQSLRAAGCKTGRRLGL